MTLELHSVKIFCRNTVSLKFSSAFWQAALQEGWHLMRMLYFWIPLSFPAMVCKTAERVTSLLIFMQNHSRGCDSVRLQTLLSCHPLGFWSPAVPLQKHVSVKQDQPTLRFVFWQDFHCTCVAVITHEWLDKLMWNKTSRHWGLCFVGTFFVLLLLLYPWMIRQVATKEPPVCITSN